ncbi:MAG TPA: TorF family putative porin, partial [Burkholderiaceae bacterium]|nr:TorF family putative porin [Burkholderiaceae bacterium]
SATLISDYRFRGVSLSDGRPAVQATLAYDHGSGFYGGLFASSVRLTSDGDTGVQGLGYVGYARRGLGALAWDLGVAYTDFSKPRDWNYADYYVGVAGTDWSARLSYAPRYFGFDYAALYTELNLTPGSERSVVPLLHVGWLRTVAAPEYVTRSRWDARLGLAYSSGSFGLQLSWVAASHADYVLSRQRRSGWVLRATWWL